MNLQLIQCGLIFFNSHFAIETYYNLTEKELKNMERIEEDCLRQLVDMQVSCSIHLLYLETGQVPARFLIQKMKLSF